MEKEIILNQNEDVFEELNRKYLLFNIEDTLYGLSLLNVKEIINVTEITSVPGSFDYIKGIINLRGGIIPIIDARLKFGMLEREYDNQTCIIILETDDSNVGLIVDSVSEVVEIEQDQLMPPPDVGDSEKNFLDDVFQFNNKLVLNIDCAKFLRNDIEFIKGINDTM